MRQGRGKVVNAAGGAAMPPQNTTTNATGGAALPLQNTATNAAGGLLQNCFRRDDVARSSTPLLLPQNSTTNTAG